MPVSCGGYIVLIFTIFLHSFDFFNRDPTDESAPFPEIRFSSKKLLSNNYFLFRQKFLETVIKLVKKMISFLFFYIRVKLSHGITN